MKNEKEVMEHINYLVRTVDRSDEKQLRELVIRLSELNWVTDKFCSDQKDLDIFIGVMMDVKEK